MAEKVDLNNLTDEQAKEIHAGFFQYTTIFIGIAVIAHLLVWVWRPWIPL